MDAHQPTPDAAEISGEEAFRLLQHRHEVMFLQAEYRRIPLRPNLDGDEIKRGRGELVEIHPDNAPEPECRCGRTFDSEDAAREHLHRVREVFSGAVDWRDIPLEFAETIETIPVEVFGGGRREVDVHDAAVFLTADDVYRNREVVRVDGEDVPTLASEFPYRIDLPFGIDSIDAQEGDIYGPTAAYDIGLSVDLLERTVRWFVNSQNQALNDLDLHYSGERAYLLSPAKVIPDPAPDESIAGLLIAGVRHDTDRLGE